MSILSTRCIYALRAVMHTAMATREKPYVSIRAMAKELDMPFHFLTKVLQDLTRHGLLTSSRGVAGGVALARRPEDISLLSIVELMEGPEVFTRCLLGLEGCGDRKPCPLHKKWAAERKRLRALFARTRLSDITRGLMAQTLRLAN
ncbi:MAG TPA: Rrf2 family transcriptional regulator [Kiritimatiellia bacterium]|nr:Rrf2 family transcriptional regulator [Kiritimatiellia bacterium]